jgi:hypothetical protein
MFGRQQRIFEKWIFRNQLSIERRKFQRRFDFDCVVSKSKELNNPQRAYQILSLQEQNKCIENQKNKQEVTLYIKVVRA